MWPTIAARVVALLFRQCRHAVGKVQLLERRYVGGNEPEGERDRPALAEAVDAEARQPPGLVRDVELTGLVERSPARRVLVRDGAEHVFQLLLLERRPRFERGQRAVPTKDRRLADLQMHVACAGLDGMRQEGVEVHACLIGTRQEGL
jgi:hypothetical protein